MKYEGKNAYTGETVIGTYCRYTMISCWIGGTDRSGRWETKVDPESIREIRDEQRD